MSRLIDDILVFRSDISPFLVHLTRDIENDNGSQRKAEGNLINILQSMKLNPGEYLLDAKNGWSEYWKLSEQEQLELFNAICFTETPLNEIHCLLEIIGRQMNLKPFGIVFLKDKLKHKNVSPVFYVNNWKADNSDIFYELCNIGDKNVAKKILPLISVFGKKVIQPGYSQPLDDKDVDFYWEREWRRPRVFGDFDFVEEDVFIGLCPHDRITFFENQFPWLKFVDPTRNMKWYADKLIDAKKRCGLKYSVI